MEILAILILTVLGAGFVAFKVAVWIWNDEIRKAELNRLRREELNRR
jgi:hypothetical protein